MRRIAFGSMRFDRGKLLASLLGVALAWTLGFVQIGLYEGFVPSSSRVIGHVGGDMRAMPRRLYVTDYSQIASAEAALDQGVVAFYPEPGVLRRPAASS